ncbi:MAG: hypothetical protein J6M02_04865 [Clostridia bacterium]|nr:hypothetical protein [Clostridia bacterium]
MNEMKILRKQNGDGIAVIVYGVTLMLVFTFLAINIVNGKIIENGYNSLRDSIQSASTGSVIHLLTSTDTSSMTETQSQVIQNNGQDKNNKDDSIPPYDIYLQLALGYIINRAPVNNPPVVDPKEDNVVVQTGNVNNFIKLDHKRVVNSTLALLEDSVIRGRDAAGLLDIHNTDYFKILMIFIEPHYNNTTYEKYFNIIVYGNKYGTAQGKTYFAGASDGDMKKVYQNLNEQINIIINANDPTTENLNSTDYALKESDGSLSKMKINVNLADGNVTGEELMRKMETKPYYMIVVKDFALPTLFRQQYTHKEEDENIFKQLFKDISGDGHLKTPIIALNSAKVERKLEGSKK